MGDINRGSTKIKLESVIRKTGWMLVSAFISGMAVQSSGIAALNLHKPEYNVVVTPSQTPIVWPKLNANGQPENYGQPTELSAAALLSTNICLSSPNCTTEAIAAGAVYYEVKHIAGVGDVIFYYDEMGNLIATQLKSEVAYDATTETTSNVGNPIPNQQTVNPTNQLGNYSQYAVGTTSASFNVDPSGSASYEIPIFTPPGCG